MVQVKIYQSQDLLLQEEAVGVVHQELVIQDLVELVVEVQEHLVHQIEMVVLVHLAQVEEEAVAFSVLQVVQVAVVKLL